MTTLASYVYDYAGIRFWAEAGIVGEWQLVLETEDRETLPRQPFAGPVEYLGCALHPPVAGDTLTAGTWPGFVQNTDRLQYGMLVFMAKKALITYTAIISARTGNIKTISVS